MMMMFTVGQDIENKWRWYLWNEENKPIGRSCVGYEDETDCWRALAKVKAADEGTPVLRQWSAPMRIRQKQA